MKIKSLFLLLTIQFCFSCKNSNSNPVVESDAIHRGEYRIGLYKDIILDKTKITHIIVIGSALKEDSDQFFQSGLGRAQKYKELWPDQQVVIMSSPDVINMTDEAVFTKYKIPVVKAVWQKFTAPLLLNEMEEFEHIASFDFYGHASPWALIIGKTAAAFDPSAHYERLKQIRSHFIDNASATLNACNTGFYIAPDLSQGLGIPVSGSLTSSVFEAIEADGLWYKEEDRTAKKYIQNNKFSYKNSLSCSLGLCARMKSSRVNYSSYWGSFAEGGLSFDKFFCNYENSRDGRCERGMALSLLSFPSVRPINLDSSLEDFKAVVFDWLCSTGNTKSYFSKCVIGLKNAIDSRDLKYQSHPGNELNCDFISCHTKIVCKYKTTEEGPLPGSCKLDAIPNASPTNVAREYLSLIRGFQDLKNLN